MEAKEKIVRSWNRSLSTTFEHVLCVCARELGKMHSCRRKNTVTFKSVGVKKMGWIFMHLNAEQQAESLSAFLLVEKVQLVPDISYHFSSKL